MFANLIRGTVAAAVVAGTLVSSAFAAGVDVNATVTGLALRGVDPVSYFTNGAPEDGDFSITSVHNGATYRFTSEDNKDLFEQNPEKYLPQYGGFCAFGTAMGVKVDGDPDLWKIVDGKLYLNLSESIQERWKKDTAGFIAKGDDQWTEIENVDPSEL
ncbi:YHS domain-containing protein [Roseibium denhamense]|uniref:YHS domain-containing protein n=1 Tax=Roseibium denhamense TaxID=76305 RepID=A0ABY1N747_9HYPH|nr:YHS domain-containing (seleno)protein [Roseibium denhamense]MTI06075.1 YHS domain-containing protein [Roseibium denhamense]SMP01421.1 YHS domain-containing protein [Roseibium denhamense]